MAEISGDKDINPFLDNLEQDNLGEEDRNWSSLADIEDRNLETGSVFDSFSPASQKLLSRGSRNKRKKPRTTSLLLAFLFGFILAAWFGLVKLYTPANLADKTQIFADINTIELSTPNLIPEEDKALGSDSKTLIEAEKIGVGQYYLDLESCSFQECVNEYERILFQANLPLQKRTNQRTHYLIQLSSAKNYLAESISEYIEAVDSLLAENINISLEKNNGSSGRIAIGLFTTVQRAKEIKNTLEALAKRQNIDVVFELKSVASAQTLTKIYVGPFADKSTANYVLAELTSTTPIKNIRITDKLSF